jgi:hypothetical protein
MKRHFDCDTVNVVPIENDGDEGSAGSHFERAIFFNEIMNAGEMKDEIFSHFSFALLIDSGWYGI